LGQRGAWWGDQLPSRYGASDAVASMGNVAAPFLAGFSLAVTVQTLSLPPGTTRLRDLSLLLFLLAAVLLIATVQAMFWARQYLVAPKDLMDWYPDWPQPYRRQGLTAIMKCDNARFRKWSNAARVTYDFGLLCLLSGLTMLAVPPGSAHGGTSVLRWVAVAIGSAATIVEAAWVCWSLASSIRVRSGGR
jgi:hypothetical protein